MPSQYHGKIHGCYPTTKNTIYTADTTHIGRHKQTGTVKIRSTGTTSTGLTGKENGNKNTNCAEQHAPQFVIKDCIYTVKPASNLT
jgi:hypothetical protein